MPAYYNVFTWNMQRGRSISWQDPTTKEPDRARERLRVLKDLVDWADFGFITEPGKDIRDNLNQFYLPSLNRNFYDSQMVDNQTDASACRPVIYSKTPIEHPTPDADSYVQYLSGAARAHRYPAAGMVALPAPFRMKLLLISFHATSGFGADENCRTYFDNFYPTPQRPNAPPMVWIVGGDFNCKGGPGVYMPTTYTHQSKHILDGFFADQYDAHVQVTAGVTPYTYLDINGGEGDLITDTSAKVHGYVVKKKYQLSDHCPVCAQLQIEQHSVESDDRDMDEANALPKGVKRKSRPIQKLKNYSDSGSSSSGSSDSGDDYTPEPKKKK